MNQIMLDKIEGIAIIAVFVIWLVSLFLCLKHYLKSDTDNKTQVTRENYES